MKKLLALMLVCLLLAVNAAAYAEFNADDFSAIFNEGIFGDDELSDDDFDEDDLEGSDDDESYEVTFDDGGYNGEWVSVDDLQIEFFLPEGWRAGEAAEDEYYFAEIPDGAAELGIVVYDDTFDGGELSDWAEANVDDAYTLGTANGLDVAVINDTDVGRLLILIPASDCVIGFNFHRDSEAALSNSMALKIAGTCTELWP